MPKVTQQVSDKALTFDSPSNVLHTRPLSFSHWGEIIHSFLSKFNSRLLNSLGQSCIYNFTPQHWHTVIYTEKMSRWAARLLIKIEKKIGLKMALWNAWACAAKISHYSSQPSSNVKTCKLQISNSNGRKCFENILKVIKQKP